MKWYDHLFYIIVIVLVGGVMFMGGSAYKWYTLKPTIIDNRGGHYDMTSGDFVWGAAPRVIDDQQVADQLTNAVKPAPIKGDKHGG